MLRLLFNRNGIVVFVKLDYAKALRIIDMIAKHRSALSGFSSAHGAT